MITVQMTLEPDLVKTVDRLAKRRGLTRSAFTREALAKAVEAEAIRDPQYNFAWDFADRGGKRRDGQLTEDAGD